MHLSCSLYSRPQSKAALSSKKHTCRGHPGTRYNNSILPIVCTQSSCSVLPFLNPCYSLHNSMVGRWHFNRRTTTDTNGLHPQNELGVSIYVVRLANFCSSDSEAVFSFPYCRAQTILHSFNLYMYVFVFYHCNKTHTLLM